MLLFWAINDIHSRHKIDIFPYCFSHFQTCLIIVINTEQLYYKWYCAYLLLFDPMGDTTFTSGEHVAYAHEISLRLKCI